MTYAVDLAQRTGHDPAWMAKRPTPAKEMGLWLQSLRKRVEDRQQAVAETIGIKLDAVRRIERGELVGAQLLFPYLSWLAEQRPDLDEELDRDLLRWCLRVGARLRVGNAKEAGSLPKRQRRIRREEKARPRAAPR